MARLKLAASFDLAAYRSVAPFALLKVAQGDKWRDELPAVAVEFESPEQLNVFLLGPGVPSPILTSYDRNVLVALFKVSHCKGATDVFFLLTRPFLLPFALGTWDLETSVHSLEGLNEVLTQVQRVLGGQHVQRLLHPKNFVVLFSGHISLIRTCLGEDVVLKKILLVWGDFIAYLTDNFVPRDLRVLWRQVLIELAWKEGGRLRVIAATAFL